MLVIVYGLMLLFIEGCFDCEIVINIFYDVFDVGCIYIDIVWVYYELGGVEQYGERFVIDVLVLWDGDYLIILVVIKVGYFCCFNDVG